MSSRGTPAKPSSRKIWIFGTIFGVVCALVVVLASGFMVETTNTDEFKQTKCVPIAIRMLDTKICCKLSKRFIKDRKNNFKLRRIM